MFTCTVVVENGMYLSAPLNSKSKESFGAGDEKSAPNDVKSVVKELVFDIRECLEKFKGIWIVILIGPYEQKNLGGAARNVKIIY